MTEFNEDQQFNEWDGESRPRREQFEDAEDFQYAFEDWQNRQPWAQPT